MMEARQIRESLDAMGVRWDDSLRSRAVDFAERDTDEKLLWLFVEMARDRRDKSKSLQERLLDFGYVGAFIAYALFDNREHLPPPIGGR